MPDTSILAVRGFPRGLRRQIHAKAALEGKSIHQVVIELIEVGFAAIRLAAEETALAPPQTGEAVFLPRHMAEALAQRMAQKPEPPRPKKKPKGTR